MANFTPGSAFLGGILIGLATGLVLWLNGQVAGISGVFARMLRPASLETAWRACFVAGLIVAGSVLFALHEPAAAYAPQASLAQTLVAGFLVGLGSRLGGGCTSGHGVCGISRVSHRGLVGTLTFMATGILTVYLVHHAWGGA